MKGKILGVSAGAAVLTFAVLVFLDSVFGGGTWVGAWSLVIVGAIIGYTAFALAIFGNLIWATVAAMFAAPFELTVFWVAGTVPMNAFPVGTAFALILALMWVGFGAEKKSFTNSNQGSLAPEPSAKPGGA